MKITLELDTLALNESDKAVLRAIARCESKSSENKTVINVNGAMFLNKEKVKDAIECCDNLSQEQIDKAKEDINSVIGGMNMTAEQAEQLIKIVRIRIRK